MRVWIAVSLVIASTLGAHAATRQPAAADAYYACIVGKGAVELQYGVQVNDALKTAIKECASLKAAAAKTNKGDGEAFEGDAAVALEKIAGVED